MQDITPLCWIELVLHVLDSKLWLEEQQITLCELEVKCNPLKGFVILHHSSFADEALSTVLTVRLSLSHHNAEQQEYLLSNLKWDTWSLLAISLHSAWIQELVFNEYVRSNALLYWTYK